MAPLKPQKQARKIRKPKSTLTTKERQDIIRANYLARSAKSFELRPYQKRVVQVAIKHFLRSESTAVPRVCLKAPTGSGKTVMMMSIIADLWKNGSNSPDKVGERGLVMIIRPSKALVQQVAAAARSILIDKLGLNIVVCIEHGDSTYEGVGNIIISTWQTLHHSPERLEQLSPGMFELVISDECHGAASPCWSSVLRWFNPDVPTLYKRKRKYKMAEMQACVVSTRTACGGSTRRTIRHVIDGNDIDDAHEVECKLCDREMNRAVDESVEVKMLGLSATPDRFDGNNVSAVFPTRIDDVSVNELIKNKILSPISYVGFTGYFGTPTGASIVENARPKVKTEDQPKPVADTNIKEEEDDVLVKHDGDAAIDDQPDAQYPQLFPINEGIIRNWEICRNQGRQSTVIFCQSVDQVCALEADFCARDVKAARIIGETDDIERAETMSRFQSGELSVLINCAALIEGICLPRIDCIIIAQTTHVPNRLEQMLGRGRRISPGTNKVDCLVLHFTLDLKNRTELWAFPPLMEDVTQVSDWLGYQGDEPVYG